MLLRALSFLSIVLSVSTELESANWYTCAIWRVQQLENMLT